VNASNFQGEFGMGGDFGIGGITGSSSVVNASFAGKIPVSLQALAIPGGYGKVMGAGIVFAMAVPGIALSSANIPGHKIAPAAISFLLLCASITPILVYLSALIRNPEDEIACRLRISPNLDCYITPQ
jgi:hypothetical protein